MVVPFARRFAVVAVALFALLTVGPGCRSSSGVVHRRLIEHQALIDFSGLKPGERVESVAVRAATPRQWDTLAPYKTSLYTHQQWRAPSGKTGVGVAHVRLPFPVTTGMLLWIAKREYTKKANDGRILNEWTDDLGRPWFEAENNQYRVRGYVVASGFQAWVVYFGHKVGVPPDPAELGLAARATDTIVPELKGKPKRDPAAKPPV